MRPKLLLPCLLILALVAACGGGKKAPPDTPTAVPTATPDTAVPETSLATYVQTTLKMEYAGDCAQADPQATDKLCSTFKGERQDMRAYVLNQGVTQGFQWAILSQQNGTWSVISTQKITPDNAAVPGIPWPLAVGAQVVVAGTGNCLNVHEGPGLDQAAVDCINDGATITLSAGPTLTADYEWWQIEGRTGWVVSDYLRYPDALNDAQQAPSDQAPAATETPAP